MVLMMGMLMFVHRLALRLQQKSVEAQQSAESKSQFLANMSHEITPPINGIIGLSDILLDTKLDETQRDFMQNLKFSARSLMTIINDILDFSKIESRKLTIKIVDFNLEKLLENLKILIGKSASDKGLEFVLCLKTIY